MKIKHLFLAVLLLLITACSNTKPVLAPDTIYHDVRLTVITSLFNDKKQTLSTLYGNTQASNAGEGTPPVPGADYRLVTWKQEAHPLWFGSQINGAILSIEHVSTSAAADGTVKIDYMLILDNKVSFTDSDTQRQRIRYILGLKPSKFPY